LDIEFTIDRLGKAMEQKAEHDAYIQGLGAEYDGIKDVWSKLSAEADALCIASWRQIGAVASGEYGSTVVSTLLRYRKLNIWGQIYNFLNCYVYAYIL